MQNKLVIYKTIHLKVPAGIKRRIQQQAQRQGLSMQDWLMQAATERLEREEAREIVNAT